MGKIYLLDWLKESVAEYTKTYMSFSSTSRILFHQSKLSIVSKTQFCLLIKHFLHIIYLWLKSQLNGISKIWRSKAHMRTKFAFKLSTINDDFTQ